MSSIILCTLNARYIHASLGLRYLLANMGELQPHTRLLEFIITHRPIDIVERILRHEPRIVGLSVYIWNVEQVTQVVALLKQVRPDIVVVLGGPEVSHEYDQQAVVALADYVITGYADLEFARLCRGLLNNDRPIGKVIRAEPVNLDEISLPYALYTDEDIAHRLVYVEASRGCPFRCEFCLSALDKTAWPFELDRFLAAMQTLYERGARHFKFVDRTFNLNVNTGVRILEFFLERLDERLFLHFEVIPDHLPERLRQLIVRFPPGSLQFEVGIQTFNPEVQALISRKQDNQKSVDNLRWLRSATQAHLHADLIVGLPGEELASIARGFDQLIALDPHEIQVGVLKRLRGTPIIRHTDTFGIRYNPYPPYTILCSDLLDFATVQRLNRFARYWDLIGNSGRFPHTRPLILGDAPFDRFLRLGDWLFETTGQTHGIALERLFELVYRSLIEALTIDRARAGEAITLDYQRATKNLPRFLLDGGAEPGQKTGAADTASTPARQARHTR